MIILAPRSIQWKEITTLNHTLDEIGVSIGRRANGHGVEKLSSFMLQTLVEGLEILATILLSSSLPVNQWGARKNIPFLWHQVRQWQLSSLFCWQRDSQDAQGQCGRSQAKPYSQLEININSQRQLKLDLPDILPVELRVGAPNKNAIQSAKSRTFQSQMPKKNCAPPTNTSFCPAQSIAGHQWTTSGCSGFLCHGS
jgi:hypothetical protein